MFMNVKLGKYYMVLIILGICLFNIAVYLFMSKQLETFVTNKIIDNYTLNP